MNIFYLHNRAEVAAHMHCDKHCVKMILETAQLLSTAHRVLDGNKYADEVGLYKATHINHPSSIWVRESDENYQWTVDLLYHLCEEYFDRYQRTHKTERLLTHLDRYPKNIPLGEFTQPPQCMPDEYKCDDSILAYRTYYNKDKAHFAKWNYCDTPEWFEKVRDSLT